MLRLVAADPLIAIREVAQVHGCATDTLRSSTTVISSGSAPDTGRCGWSGKPGAMRHQQRRCAMHDEIVQEEEEIAAEREAEGARGGTAILQRPIRELPTMREPVCVAPDVSIRSAVALMNSHNAGCVLIEQGGH